MIGKVLDGPCMIGMSWVPHSWAEGIPITGGSDLHVALEQRGWVGGDFYDGCLMYDFASGRTRVIDFECYHRGGYVNETGRLPGSTRFMAPEEFARAALIDSRTTVFNLARMLEIFLARQDIPDLAPLVERATAVDPLDRPRDVAALQRRWREVQSGQAGERPSSAST